jgi:NAD(P) transhydrogenase subunit alpha
MKIVIPKEYHPGELRVPMIPVDVKLLTDRGAAVEIESGMGETAGFNDSDYREVGAGINSNRHDLITSADVILRIRKPPLEEVTWLREKSVHVSFLDPFKEKELLESLASQGVSAVSMEMIPRISRAQKMDALTSQANLAGYVAIILAADRLNRILPMMMTAAGTIAPSRVFVIGVGVAGLQAIATARRLGARVSAFDTRPAVEEQVQSLGAKFLKVDLGETGETKEGYAKALTPEQLARQSEAMAKQCAISDIVVTTAQVFGRKAPLIVTDDMIAAMRAGSVIVDLAAESGGNVEGTVSDKEVVVHGVKIIGPGNLPGRVAVHASQMYSSNLKSFIMEYWNDDTKSLVLPMDDEIIRGCLVTHEHEIISELFKRMM